MSSKRDIDLQRYHDGELDPRQAREVYQRLQRDPAERARLQALRQMRDLLREVTEAEAEQANFDHLWTRVNAHLGEREPVPVGQRLGGWLRRYGLLAAAALIALVLGVVLLGGPGAVIQRNDAQIESLEAGPGVTPTVFTIDDPEDSGETTVIWLSAAEDLEINK
jgi:anti-sigma factor RsiW